MSRLLNGEVLGALAVLIAAISAALTARRSAHVERRRLRLEESDAEGRSLRTAWERVEQLEADLKEAQEETRRERKAREALEADVARMRRALRDAGVDGF